MTERRRLNRVAKFVETVKSLTITLLLFVFLRAFLIEAYRIPTGSMIPTLLVGDWLFVSKIAYGPHVPFTQFSFPGLGEPHRGDVVVFESPFQADEAAAGADPTPTLVKRLIGMPGDTLFARAGVVYVNGTAGDPTATSADQSIGDPHSTNVLFDWQSEFVITASRFGPPPSKPELDNWGPLVIPPSRYWMMGDNRYDSKDSRYWGFVPRANIRGRPLFVYYSFVPSTESDRALSFVTDIRWHRLGHWIR